MREKGGRKKKRRKKRKKKSEGDGFAGVEERGYWGGQDLILITLDRHECFSVFHHLQKDKQRKQCHSLKLGKKRRESSKRSYYIISPRVIIKAIITNNKNESFESYGWFRVVLQCPLNRPHNLNTNPHTWVGTRRHSLGVLAYLGRFRARLCRVEMIAIGSAWWWRWRCTVFRFMLLSRHARMTWSYRI